MCMHFSLFGTYALHICLSIHHDITNITSREFKSLVFAGCRHTSILFMFLSNNCNYILTCNCVGIFSSLCRLKQQMNFHPNICKVTNTLKVLETKEEHFTQGVNWMNIPELKISEEQFLNPSLEATLPFEVFSEVRPF